MLAGVPGMPQNRRYPFWTETGISNSQCSILYQGRILEYSISILGVRHEKLETLEEHRLISKDPNYGSGLERPPTHLVHWKTRAIGFFLKSHPGVMRRQVRSTRVTRRRFRIIDISPDFLATCPTRFSAYFGQCCDRPAIWKPLNCEQDRHAIGNPLV